MGGMFDKFWECLTKHIVLLFGEGILSNHWIVFVVVGIANKAIKYQVVRLPICLFVDFLSETSIPVHSDTTRSGTKNAPLIYNNINEPNYQEQYMKSST